MPSEVSSPTTPTNGETENRADFVPLDQYLDRLDPSHRLADEQFRIDTLVAADPYAAAIALREVHQHVVPTDGTDIDDWTVNLGHEKKGTIAYRGVVGEERGGVFQHALDAAKTAAQQDDLDLAGRILAGTIVGLQTFSDGNKRTARAVYLLVKHGFDGSAEDRALYSRLTNGSGEVIKEVPTLRPNAEWNKRAFLAHLHPEKQDFADQLRWQTSRWQQQKPRHQRFVDVLKEQGSVSSELIVELADALQEDVFGPYLLEKATGHRSYEYLQGGTYLQANFAPDKLWEAFSELDDEKARALLEDSKKMKVEMLNFLIDRALQPVTDPPSERFINITGMPLDQPAQAA